MNADPDSRVLVQAVTAWVARRPPGPHPSPAELFALAHGALDDLAADEIREHAALCASCSETLLALAEESPRAAFEPASPPAPAVSRWRWLPALVAAALFLVTASLHMVLRAPVGRIASPALIELIPEPVAGDRSRNVPSAEPPPSAGTTESLVLVLGIEPAAGATPRATVRDLATGRVHWQSPVVVSDRGTVALAVPPRALAPGRYEVELDPGDAPGEIRKFRFTILDSRP